MKLTRRQLRKLIMEALPSGMSPALQSGLYDSLIAHFADGVAMADELKRGFMQAQGAQYFHSGKIMIPAFGGLVGIAGDVEMERGELSNPDSWTNETRFGGIGYTLLENPVYDRRTGNMVDFTKGENFVIDLPASVNQGSLVTEHQRSFTPIDRQGALEDLAAMLDVYKPALEEIVEMWKRGKAEHER